ncbi:MAG: YddF family protein [Gallionella sp.]|nr:DUF1874 domain-containing protein [Gallionella sp.]
MTTYLLNTPILTSYGEWNFTGPLTVEQAQTHLKNGFQSAIGHEASAQFLSQLLGVEVPMNRIAVTMQAGDTALVLRIKSRLPEGKLLTREEIADIPFELGWLTHIK